MLKFQDIVKLQIAKLMHAVCNNRLFEKHFKFSKLKNIHNYQTRGASNLNYGQIQARTEKSKNSIFFVSPKVMVGGSR